MANYGYDKILGRLIIIVSRLNNGEELSVVSLAKELDVDVRTIQRDFNEHLKDSLPICQDKKLWKMKDGFKNSSSAEETAMCILMEKLIKSAGELFASKANKFLARNHITTNAFCMKSDMTNIDDKINESIMIAGYPRFKKIDIMNNDILESKDEIESYFAHIQVAHMQHVDDNSKTFLGAVKGEKYLVLVENANNSLQYNSIDELIEAGWRISKSYKYKVGLISTDDGKLL